MLPRYLPRGCKEGSVNERVRDCIDRVGVRDRDIIKGEENVIKKRERKSE